MVSVPCLLYSQLSLAPQFSLERFSPPPASKHRARRSTSSAAFTGHHRAAHKMVYPPRATEQGMLEAQLSMTQHENRASAFAACTARPDEGHAGRMCSMRIDSMCCIVGLATPSQVCVTQRVLTGMSGCSLSGGCRSQQRLSCATYRAQLGYRGSDGSQGGLQELPVNQYQ